MNKILLIIQREYLTRVRKKSFIIMTIIGPLLFAALMIVPVWLALQETDVQSIKVVDETGLFFNKIKSTSRLEFYFTDLPTGQAGTGLEKARQNFKDEPYTAILYIPHNVLNARKIDLLYKKSPGFATEQYIRRSINDIIEDDKLKAKFNISKEDLKTIEANIRLSTKKYNASDKDEETFTGLSWGVGFAAGMLIYLFIFLYGVQVMRGVIEEKTSRIVELIISSVRPFQLMLGKIVGIALVGLTQFLLWVVFTLIIVGGVFMVFQDSIAEAEKRKVDIEQFIPETKTIKGLDLPTGQTGTESMMIGIYEKIDTINFPLLIGMFILYFLGGYLLYSALFAAVGSAVDAEADTQQFMLPITIPLIIAIVVAQFIMNDPDGSIAFWFSIIPLTSPIIMMVRIPFGVPYWELALSIGLLIIGFVAATRLAAKIYRTGILMYGKKITYRELWKWLLY
ncbi:ABC transporter permease [bacterium AH-315-M05]|nr:ABC transporter permease [bacterium AH-315-M05]